MIRLRIAATGAALVVLLHIGCRDAPTEPVAPHDATLLAALTDSASELPGPAHIQHAYTEVLFYDGSNGGEPMMEIKTGHQYIGNRSTINTLYSATGNGVSISNRIGNEHHSFYNPFLLKRWDEVYDVPTGSKCDLDLRAESQHQAWWDVWFRGLVPNYVSAKVTLFSQGSLQVPPCEPEPPPDGNNGGGGSSGGWVTIETCYYWAHFVNGVLVDIELRYCAYDMIPVADE